MPAKLRLLQYTAPGPKGPKPSLKTLFGDRPALRAMRLLRGKLQTWTARRIESAPPPSAVRRFRSLEAGLVRQPAPSRIETSPMTQTIQGALAQESTGPATLVAAGALEVRLGREPDEIAAAQRLRYRVFYEEMSAEPTPAMRADRRDFDELDAYCDHLLVIDHARPADEAVVGTYRLLRQQVAETAGGFYSAGEFDLSPLFAASGGTRFLELGRSCVHPDYRNNGTIQLLWRGITIYTARHKLGFMFGCASLPGTDPDALALPLSFLHHDFRAPEEIRVRALPERYVEMNRIPPEAIDRRAALRSLPPLIKGYLRLGCYIGDGAVIDPQFGTTDVFILLPVGRIGERYLTRLDRTAQAGEKLSPLRLAGECGGA